MSERPSGEVVAHGIVTDTLVRAWPLFSAGGRRAGAAIFGIGLVVEASSVAFSMTTTPITSLGFISRLVAPRGTPENRPLGDGSKPATTGWRTETVVESIAAVG